MKTKKEENDEERNEERNIINNIEKIIKAYENKRKFTQIDSIKLLK